MEHENTGEGHRPFSSPADAQGVKAHYDTNLGQRQHNGVNGFLREASNLLIMVGVLGLIFVITRWF
ncbi:hypothetical protein Q5741_02935 [Paenibacillus sp. JX-17]|uniref:YqzM family protein n=1 Tax=Paenibacillus lacisoli TaxID=3064525 RepID=A0ABT9CCD8_9BACL|nr:hypothetical protein [Paenibacillus sp. JX-17]MDO7905366.1 hypothetical protein [Paenibacillus sp. JX-17]